MDAARYEEAFSDADGVIVAGKLPVPSGQIVACDPYFCASAAPFLRRVPPGDYLVQLKIVALAEWGARIALARVVFDDTKKASRVEAAVMEDTGDSFYFVDSGVGSFMDELTRSEFSKVLSEHYRLNPSGNYYHDVLAAEFRSNAFDSKDPHDLGRWNFHHLPNSGLGIAMFSAGLGDGSYGSFWGLSETGDVLTLTTDFNLL